MKHLAALEDLLTEATGVQLTRGGLQSSLAAFAEGRTRELGLNSVEEYLHEVATPESAEHRRLLDVISVPHTWFFRDREQLETLVGLVATPSEPGRATKIWVPACATGEDAFSLAILCASRGIEVEVLASDISPRSLAAAKAARYGAFSLRDFPAQFRDFLIEDASQFRVCDDIRRRVTFVEHNLMDPPVAMARGWDLILCRNVFIYFAHSTALSCAGSLARALAPQGWLFLGAGEMAFGVPPELEPKMVGNRVGFQLARHSPRVVSSSPPSFKAIDHAGPPVIGAAAAFSGGGREARNPQDSLRPTSIRSLVKTEPEDLSGHRVFESSNLSEIAGDIMRMAAETPSDAKLRMLLSMALYSIGDFSGALRQARATLLLDRRLWPAALYQGLCLEKLGEPKKARADFAYAARLLESPETREIELPSVLRGLSGDLLEMVRAKSG